LHGGQRREGQFLNVSDQSKVVGEALTRLFWTHALENGDVSAGGKDLAVGSHE
jgi:hypothetical protein